MQLLGTEHVVLDQLQAAVVVTDLDGVITRWNHAAEELFGWTSREAIGRDVVELLVPPTARDEAHATMQSLAAGQGWSGEYQVLHKDGHLLDVHATDSVLTDDRGIPTAIVGLSFDISERKRAEQRLALQYEVTQSLAEAEDLAEAAPRILRSVCETTGWHVGALWIMDDDAGVLRPISVWQADPATEPFAAETRGRTFAPGEGLPGVVFQSRAVRWVPDIEEDHQLVRSDAAREAGLHAALLFPILLGHAVLGVMEFFDAEIREPDEALSNMLFGIGGQVGQFVERNEAEEDLRLTEARRRAILEASLDAIVAMDQDGRITEFSRSAGRAFGYSREEILGQEITETLIAPSSRAQVLDTLEQFRSTGRSPLLGARVELTARRKGGSEFPVEVGFSQVDFPGRPLLKCAIRDITERKEAEEELARTEAERTRAYEAEQRARAEAEAARRELALLAEASSVLAAGILDFERIVSTAAELAVPHFADWCAVDLIQEDGSIERVGLAHSDPEKENMALELDRRYERRSSSWWVPNVLATGRSELVPEVSDELIAQAPPDDPFLAVTRALGLRSMMVVPLVARGRTLGAMTFASARSGRIYGPRDLILAEDLARRAAVAVDNARLYHERSSAARTLQQTLLPPALPAIPGVELAALYRPSGEGNDIGGDFYDIFETGDGTWGVVIGDVCGKGVEAAAITGLVRHTVRAVAMKERRPGAILTSLNEALLGQSLDERFCTVCYVRVVTNRRRARLTVSSGGHPLPLVLRRDGTVEVIGRPGTLLGIFPEPVLTDAAVDLAPGDAVVLYTDGLTEERDGDTMFGEDRLRAALRSAAGFDAQAIAGTIGDAVAAFRPETPRDDMAILALRVTP